MQGERMKEEMETTAVILEALAWRASELGTSYGKLSAALTSQQIKEVAAEYLKMCRKRQEQEQRRLQQAREKTEKERRTVLFDDEF